MQECFLGGPWPSFLILFIGDMYEDTEGILIKFEIWIKNNKWLNQGSKTLGYLNLVLGE